MTFVDILLFSMSLGHLLGCLIFNTYSILKIYKLKGSSQESYQGTVCGQWTTRYSSRPNCRPAEYVTSYRDELPSCSNVPRRQIPCLINHVKALSAVSIRDKERLLRPDEFGVALDFGPILSLSWTRNLWCLTFVSILHTIICVVGYD